MAQDPLEPPLHFPRKMHPVDYMMFRGEHDPRSRTAMLSVSLLDTVPDFDRLRAVYDRASRVVVRLRQHVVEPVVPLTAPQWIVDPDFDLSYHVRRVRLPEPGTIRQLLDFAQPIHAAPFDTARPAVGGATSSRAERGRRERGARSSKMHHAITDGIGGIELAEPDLRLRARRRPRSAAAPTRARGRLARPTSCARRVRRAPITRHRRSRAADAVAWSASGRGPSASPIAP